MPETKATAGKKEGGPAQKSGTCHCSAANGPHTHDGAQPPSTAVRAPKEPVPNTGGKPAKTEAVP